MKKPVTVNYPGPGGRIEIKGALRVEVAPEEVIQLYSNAALLIDATKKRNSGLVGIAYGRLEALVQDITLRS